MAGGAGIAGLAGCLGNTDGGSGGSGNNGSSSANESNTTEGGGNGPTTIRYAGVSGAELNDLMAMFNQAPYIKENVFEHNGEKYEFELVEVQSTPVAVSTIGSKEADAGLLAYSSLATAIQEETIPSGPTIIAPLTYDGPRYADTYDSKTDSGINEVSDMAGKSLGVNGIGSAIDIAARVVLTRNDINLNEVQFREVSFGAMSTTLEEDRVNVGTFIQPFYQMNMDDVRVVFETTDAFGSFLKIFITVRNDFLSKNGEAIRAWMEDYWRGIKWWRDAANEKKRLDIAEQVLGLPRDLLSELVQTKQGYYHGEEGLRINPEWIQKPVDGMREVDFLDSEIEMSQYIDNAYLPEGANTEPEI